MSEVPRYEVDVVFKRNLPQNELEISHMINNLSSFVDDETLVGLLPFIDDAEEVVKKNRDEEKEKITFELPQFGSGEPTNLSKEKEDVGNS
jgi:hypothetical protein